MEPTFHTYQCVLATRNFDKVHRGDVVVFNHQGEELIKRVVYLPGDRIKEYRSGSRWLTPANREQEVSFDFGMPDTRVTTVPAGKIYVMGDNFEDSIDSRDFGMVELGSVKAKVLNCDGGGPVPVAARLASTFSAQV